MSFARINTRACQVRHTANLLSPYALIQMADTRTKAHKILAAPQSIECLHVSRASNKDTGIRLACASRPLHHSHALCPLSTNSQKGHKQREKIVGSWNAKCVDISRSSASGFSRTKYLSRTMSLATRINTGLIYGWPDRDWFIDMNLHFWTSWNLGENGSDLRCELLKVWRVEQI